MLNEFTQLNIQTRSLIGINVDKVTELLFFSLFFLQEFSLIGSS